MRKIPMLIRYKNLSGFIRLFRRLAHTKPEYDLSKIRNIGILAHIDAGKTTTTERMLFYSGSTSSMGEVHHGNTVTDYMDQERQRGITIVSAAVSFEWQDHQINLIDTPGHIDFTMEVEQSLAVLDGAIVVLDSSAGVEAQTARVWEQARAHGVPCLLYLNKMDRADASCERALASVRDKLGAVPLQLHLPLHSAGQLVGLLDLLEMQEVVWRGERGERGRQYTRRALHEGHAMWEAARRARRHLVDTMAGMDDELAGAVIADESLEGARSSAAALWAAARRLTLQLRASPALLGSSYRCVGVQPLLDGVVRLLPDAAQAPQRALLSCFPAGEVCARAFKVTHDAHRGALTFLRVYAGRLAPHARLHNLARDAPDQGGALYVPYADELAPVESVSAGNIAVLANLKSTSSGEMVTSSSAAARRAMEALTRRVQAALAAAGVAGAGGEADAEGEAGERAAVEQVLAALAAAGLRAPPAAAARLHAESAAALQPARIATLLLGVGVEAPAGVVERAVEAGSARELSALEAALGVLAREDPSLQVRAHPDTGQLLLGGVGELQLEVALERLRTQFRLDAELGPVQIAYRETLPADAAPAPAPAALTLERRVAGALHRAHVQLAAVHRARLPPHQAIIWEQRGEWAAQLAQLRPWQVAAVRRGVAAAMLHGPTLAAPMVEVQVVVQRVETARGTADTMLAAAVTQCLRKVWAAAGSVVLEPHMRVVVSCPEELGARVLHDLARRGAHVTAVSTHNRNKVVEAVVAGGRLVGYATALRSLTSGTAQLDVRHHAYRPATLPTP